MGSSAERKRANFGSLEPWALVLAVVLLAIGARFLAITDGNNSYYSYLGERTGVDFGNWPPFFYTGGGGDGEMFAALGADPLGSEIPFEPSIIHRYTRIGYSLGAYLLSGGNEHFVLPALALAGLMSVGLVALLAARLRPVLGRQAWLIVLNPALYVGFVGDTAEPLGMAMLVMAIGWNSGLSAFVLGLVRPTYAVALFGKWKAVGLVVVVAVLVRAFAVLRFGGPALFGLGESVFDLPLLGYLRQPTVAGIGIAIAALATLIVGIRRRDWAWMASGLFVLTFGVAVTEYSINVFRAAAMLPILWAFGPNFSRDRFDEVGEPALKSQNRQGVWRKVITSR